MTHQDKSLHTTPQEQQGANGSKEEFLEKYKWLVSLKPAPQVTANGTTKSYMRFCEEHGHWSQWSRID